MTDTSTVDRAAGDGAPDRLRRQTSLPTDASSCSFTVTPGRLPRLDDPVARRRRSRSTRRRRLTVIGLDGYFATVDRDGGDGPYTVTALVPVEGNDPGQLNEELLRAAGDGLSARGQQPLPAASPTGSSARSRASSRPRSRPNRRRTRRTTWPRRSSRSSSRATSPTTRTSATLNCAGISTVECFAQFKQRLLPVLRGDDGRASCATSASRPASPRGSCRARGTGRPARSGSSTATPTPGSRSTSRAIGWVTFDPTGGGVAQLAPLPSGSRCRPAPSLAVGQRRPC